MSASSPPPHSARSPRIEQLDGIRALAIAMVFLNHAFRIKLMWAGVDLFFILSGFLITGILLGAKQRTLRDYFAHFYSRRARRILPPYLLLLAITPLFYGFAWLRFGYMYLFLMNSLAPLKMVHPDNLGVLWSLAVEEQFYFFWPLVVFFLSERAVAWVAAACVVGAPLLRFACTPFFSNYTGVYSLTPFRMDLLATGALLAIAWRHRRGLFVRFGIYGPLLSVAALGALFLLARRPGFTITANRPLPNMLIYEITLLASLGIVLWALSGRGVAILKLGWVRYLGRISYTFYLIHTTILIVLDRYLDGRWLIGAVALELSILYSALSWNWLEQPILYGRRPGALRGDALADEQAITRTG